MASQKHTIGVRRASRIPAGTCFAELDNRHISAAAPSPPGRWGFTAARFAVDFVPMIPVPSTSIGYLTTVDGGLGARLRRFFEPSVTFWVTFNQSLDVELAASRIL